MEIVDDGDQTRATNKRENAIDHTSSASWAMEVFCASYNTVDGFLSAHILIVYNQHS